MKRATKQKTGAMIGVVYLIAFAVFNMLVFFIFDEKNGVFWTSYAFICVAFAVQILSMILSFKSFQVEAVFFGIPLASLSVYYFFAALFAGVVFMIFQNAAFKLAFAVQIIILAVYGVIAIVTLLSRDYVQDVSDNIQESTTAVKMLRVDVDTLMPLVSDAGLKAALRHLSETVRYSDPMSSSAVTDLEEQILQKVDELRIYCENQQVPEALRTCKETELLFLRRNQVLKVSK